MRLNFSKSWIFRGWITCALFTHLYAQSVVSSCDKSHYLTSSGCCKKCGPGFHVHADCVDSEQTRCIKCASDEYQPGWTKEKSCLKQKFCDTGKGFKENTENLMVEETCKCISGLQCSAINCEFCERIPTCGAGQGLEPEPEATNGRQICLPCKRGFFSAGGAKPCKQWTNCKAEGRSETRPGVANADAVCGPHVTGPSSSWVIVSVLSVITVLCLLILILFCYKDKLKLLSVNLRSCVQNLKRSRIQQETLAPLYHSGVVGGIAGGPGGPKCMPCETTKLICQAPHSVGEETPCTYPTPVPEVKVSMPESEETKRRMVVEGQSEGSGGPEEVSEDEDFTSAAPLVVASCACGVPVREPLEVGENEDCSQAVSSGTPGTCYCRGPDGEERGREEKNRSERAERGGEKGGGDPEKVILTMSEASVASLVSLSPPLLHTSPAIPPPSPHPELCLPLTQAHARPEVKVHPTDRSQVKAEELYRLTSTESESSSAGTASAMSSVSPLMTSSSVGDLYLDKPSGGSGQEQGQGLSWGDGRGNKLSSGDTELECPPESLQSQLAEPTLTSGQVSGNHNTTFISSGQVMNFSGDVIVVYVSQTSLGAEGAGPDDDFGSPVQEQASETAPFFQSSLRDSATHSTLRDETLPVQEAMEQLSHGK